MAINIKLHSGGAIGSDRAWEEIGKKWGLQKENVFHYYKGDKTPYGTHEISDEDFEEGKKRVRVANLSLKRRPEKYMNLLARNWCQVKYSDATFAIIQDVDINTGIVFGGTGWAVAMSIIIGHPTWIFSQKDLTWRVWSKDSLRFIKCKTPILTNNFAGIGTREITQSGLQAIQDCYIEYLAK